MNKKIDLRKYEGHTPAPWICTHSPVNGGGQFWSVVDHTQPTDVGDDTLGNWRIADIIDFEADAQLMADAPLLLEEFKRLSHRLMLAESALGEVRAYHEDGQGNLSEILEHYRDKEGVEMPNAFDEVIE